MDILERIVAAKKIELQSEKEALPLAGLEHAAEDHPARDFESALQGKRCALIAEVKRKSPSKGVLRAEVDPASRAADYERSGAAAISVLTDRQFFGGGKEDLVGVRKSTSIPVLRKDFIIEPYQVYQSKFIGADALLLIARILGQGLGDLLRLAESLRLHALVEVHSKEDLLLAVDAGARVVGINNRDLRTFHTDIHRSIELAPHVPKGIVVVSESGIHSREDVRALSNAGIHAYLVGEALMKADDIGNAFAELMSP